MHKVNKNFIENKLHFLIQSILVVVFMALVLLPLGSIKADVVTAIGASTLAASVFILFALPNSPVAAIHRVIGAYFIALVLGILWHYIYMKVNTNITNHPLALDLCGAFAVGTTVLIMALFDLIHPPTVGFSLALVIGPWNHYTIYVVIVAVIVLCLIKISLKNWFINLL